MSALPLKADIEIAATLRAPSRAQLDEPTPAHSKLAAHQHRSHVSRAGPQSFAHAHAGGCGAWGGAFGSVGRPARTHQRYQGFIVLAANGVRTGHETQGRGGPGVSLCAPGGPAGPGGPADPCGPCAPTGPAGPCGPCAPAGPAGPCGPGVGWPHPPTASTVRMAKQFKSCRIGRPSSNVQQLASAN